MLYSLLMRCNMKCNKNGMQCKCLREDSSRILSNMQQHMWFHFEKTRNCIRYKPLQSGQYKACNWSDKDGRLSRFLQFPA